MAAPKKLPPWMDKAKKEGKKPPVKSGGKEKKAGIGKKKF